MFYNSFQSNEPLIENRAIFMRRVVFRGEELSRMDKDSSVSLVSGGPKKQKQLTGNSHSTAFVFLDHAVSNDHPISW